MYSLAGYGSMIADRVRMDAFAQALRQATTPESVVVDIGTGTGILALLACRFGARRVYAIEPDDAIQVAREIAAANGYADRIDFIQAVSTKVMASGQPSQPRASFKQSTFFGVPLSAAKLRKRAAGYVPSLTEEGRIARQVLESMNDTLGGRHCAPPVSPVPNGLSDVARGSWLRRRTVIWVQLTRQVNGPALAAPLNPAHSLARADLAASP